MKKAKAIINGLATAGLYSILAIAVGGPAALYYWPVYLIAWICATAYYLLKPEDDENPYR